MRGLKCYLPENPVALTNGRIPRGMRGLKWAGGKRMNEKYSRIPRGMRGLKYPASQENIHNAPVASREGCVIFNLYGGDEMY